VCISFDIYWCQVVLIVSAGAAFDLPDSKVKKTPQKNKKTRNQRKGRTEKEI